MFLQNYFHLKPTPRWPSCDAVAALSPWLDSTMTTGSGSAEESDSSLKIILAFLSFFRLLDFYAGLSAFSSALQIYAILTDSA
jgi:hypothetical protein